MIRLNKFAFCFALFATTASLHAEKLKIALNWKPEPQFGGFYAALEKGHFKKEGLEVELVPGGMGAPVPQLVANKNFSFGVVTGDEVIVGRSRGLDLVAIYASYQTFPQGIMAHKGRGFKKIDDVFSSPGVVSLQSAVPYSLYLLKKYPPSKNTKVVPYVGGIGPFLNNKNFSQQCFVTSEPIAAKAAGVESDVFLIAEAGYNPYASVLITRRDVINSNPELVKKLVRALRLGWNDYLNSPQSTNSLMAKLNPAMTLETFKLSAEAQAPLIRNDLSSTSKEKMSLGQMSLQRWKSLSEQLLELKVVDKIEKAETYFWQD